MWNQDWSAALTAYRNRDRRRSFDDGPIAGLRIQEYWHPDVPPRGSEQEITFYLAESESFDDIRDFASLVFLFQCAEDIAESARQSIELSVPNSIECEAFVTQWKNCADKVAAPTFNMSNIDVAFALSDSWNDKFYVARDKCTFYAVCWSTTA